MSAFSHFSRACAPCSLGSLNLTLNLSCFKGKHIREITREMTWIDQLRSIRGGREDRRPRPTRTGGGAIDRTTTANEGHRFLALQAVDHLRTVVVDRSLAITVRNLEKKPWTTGDISGRRQFSVTAARCRRRPPREDDNLCRRAAAAAASVRLKETAAAAVAMIAVRLSRKRKEFWQ